MTQSEIDNFLRQFDLAAAEVEKLRQLFPGCFDANGQPIVAVARMLPPLEEIRS